MWSIGEMDPDEFVRTGEMGEKKPMPLAPQLRAAVDKNIDEIMNTGTLVIRE